MIAIGIYPFCDWHTQWSNRIAANLEAMKKQETVWLTGAESVVQASSIIVSKSK